MIAVHYERYVHQLILNFIEVDMTTQKKSSDIISFKPLQENDLDLLCTWLKKPHVKKWWDDSLTDEELKYKYKSRIGNTIIVPFIVYMNHKPLGFIQYYHANKMGDGWWPGELEGTVGIDQFIGEEDYINRGYGTSIIKEFVKKLFADIKINKIIADVDPDNKSALRCYEKVGFKFDKEVITPDGFAHLLVMYK
jgi:RimJ/RimL family protein N-acetyltransferase